jgi:hypothetical protein
VTIGSYSPTTIKNEEGSWNFKDSEIKYHGGTGIQNTNPKANFNFDYSNLEGTGKAIVNGPTPSESEKAKPKGP